MIFYRQCQKCGNVKPITDFTPDNRIRSGFLWKCKACEREDDRRYVESVKRGKR